MDYIVGERKASGCDLVTDCSENEGCAGEELCWARIELSDHRWHIPFKCAPDVRVR